MEFKFGKGYISGALSLTLAILSLAGVICFHYPEYLTTPELRAVYSVPVLRLLLACAIGFSAILGLISYCLASKKFLSLSGIVVAAIAALLGGPNVETPESIHQRVYIGLDWFVLDLLVVTLIFVPLEKIWGRLDLSIFRSQWTTDLAHFFFSHVLVQIMSFLILTPALFLQPHLSIDSVSQKILQQPVWIQFLEVLLIADFTQYWIHRAFHRIPFLWKFHAIHHSAQTMDWLAGSRLHLLDIVVTRGLILIPLLVMGFDPKVMQLYLVFVAIQATFIHTNVRWRLAKLDKVLATPAFHHWHHAADAKAVDKNFSVHVPLWDLIFGSYYMPENWPTQYGLMHSDVPPGYWGQLVYPLKKPKN
ncbi:MAG: sterol desaturase family protein [Proteobacteria bacterium]|nr:sterol desaturase family protein [Pseudomonadota bacterium]